MCRNQNSVLPCLGVIKDGLMKKTPKQKVIGPITLREVGVFDFDVARCTLPLWDTRVN